MDGLALIAPLIVMERDKRTLPPHRTLVEDPALLDELQSPEDDAFLEMAVVQSQTLLDAFMTIYHPMAEDADEEFLSRLSENYAFSFNVDALLEPFTGPTLILAGRQDSVVGYRDTWAILENYPRGSFVVLDRAGHCLEIEQEGLFRALVNEWLDRVEESASS